ncbi:hypothetical protein OXX79_007124 [Metschnikowia pulcherrima]
MSTQSGIKASDELLGLANESASPALVITLSSDSTQLVVDESYTHPAASEIKSVLESLKDHFSAEFPEPKFAIVSPHETHEGYFVSFIPDSAPIRQKMLFASTKKYLAPTIGDEVLKEEYS